MSPQLKGFYKVGGVAFVASGLLFLVRAILDLIAGPPPSTGREILSWVASNSLIVGLESEILFFAAMFLVPAVIALNQSLAVTDRVKAAIGCGVFAVAIPVLVVLLIVHGRLVYPIYGMRANTPELAALVVLVFYGGMHGVYLVLATATIVLSLAMRGPYGNSIANLGFVTALFDIAASYPDKIGPVLTLVSQVFFASWFIAVGWQLAQLQEKTAAAPQLA